jgi:hypothetical protein
MFDHFDASVYQPNCTDPATHCLGQGPSYLGNSETEYRT